MGAAVDDDRYATVFRNVYQYAAGSNGFADYLVVIATLAWRRTRAVPCAPRPDRHSVVGEPERQRRAR